MLLRLCQLKSLVTLAVIFVSLNSCSWQNRKIADPDELVNVSHNRWFSTNLHHAIILPGGEVASHDLMDFSPQFQEGNKIVNVSIFIPHGSNHSYSIDLASGQKFYSHSYCVQKDVWNNSNDKIFRPPFSVAVIPRVLDQLGDPQKVLVWSKRKIIKDIFAHNFFKVKLLGAYLEKSCADGNCLGKSNWLSRLVFVAVDMEDKHYSKIDTLEEFKKFVDWERTTTILANLDGRNVLGDMIYPATKIGSLIDFDSSFEYFKKWSIFLEDAELKKIQKGCHILYEKLWSDVGEERPEDRPAKNIKEMKEKFKLTAELRKKKMPVGFARRLVDFTKKYFNEIATCERFVYHGNYNENSEKFWFLSYMGIFFKLHKDGHYFDCANRNWQKNILNEIGKSIYDIRKQIERCTEQDIDLAMSYLPNYLKKLKVEKSFYRFIDYDNHPYGTHKKLYSWVKVNHVHMGCENDPNIKMYENFKIIPEEVAWKKRFSKDLAEKLKIIQ